MLKAEALNERVRFPAKPMVGVVGVATDGETYTALYTHLQGMPDPELARTGGHVEGRYVTLLNPVKQKSTGPGTEVRP